MARVFQNTLFHKLHNLNYPLSPSSEDSACVFFLKAHSDSQKSSLLHLMEAVARASSRAISLQSDVCFPKTPAPEKFLGSKNGVLDQWGHCEQLLTALFRFCGWNISLSKAKGALSSFVIMVHVFKLNSEKYHQERNKSCWNPLPWNVWWPQLWTSCPAYT